MLNIQMLVIALSFSTACVSDMVDGDDVNQDMSLDGKADGVDMIHSPRQGAAIGSGWTDVGLLTATGRVMVAYPTDRGHPLASAVVYENHAGIRLPTTIPDGAELVLSYTNGAGTPSGSHNLIYWPHPEDVLFTDRTVVDIAMTNYGNHDIKTLNYQIQGVGHLERDIHVVIDETGEDVFVANTWDRRMRGPAGYFFSKSVRLAYDYLPPQGTRLRFELVNTDTDSMTTKDCILLDRDASSAQQVPCR